ncbi:hypothetical protein AX14_000918 [Amanita brunnescens Koide BX004]|nr:hypothetical protein AX14_000918 [Amanita brunnescens Koide BX004]
MLLIVRVDEYDEIGEHETVRALPSVEWLRAHQLALEDVLGNKRRFELLMNAAADSAKGFRTEKSLDFAVCDSECGYCGRCEY